MQIKKIASVFDQKYKYFVLVLVFAFTLTLFSSLANRSSQAGSSTQNSTATTDKGIEELKTLAQDNSNLTTTKPAVAGTTTTNSNTTSVTEESVAVQQNRALVETTMYVMQSTIQPAPTGFALVNNGKEQYYKPIYAKQGAFGTIVAMTGMLYTEQPASVEVWAQTTLNKINPNIYAADSSSTYNPGQGYNLLSPILNLWTAMRNIVYVFYILILIVISFMVVFRNKLGGNAALNLFNSIPSIAISLVLVTFSYPLSAVFIDVITIGSGAVYGILVEGKDAPGHFLTENQYDGGLVSQGLGPISDIGKEKFSGKTDLQIDDKFVSVWRVFGSAAINPTADGANSLVPQDVPISNILTSIIGSITGNNISNIILALVFTFSAFTAQLKLFFSLLKDYVYLTLYPIISPFVFLAAAIPNQAKTIIPQYFLTLLASSLSFIVVYAVFLVIIIISRDTSTLLSNTAWLPPLLGYTGSQTGSSPLLSANIVRPLLGFALFISTPMIPDMIKNLITKPNKGPLSTLGSDVLKSAQAGGAGVFGAIKGLDDLATGPSGLNTKKKSS